ncbi:hypothetical protein DFJ73DRAFT_827821 [Zopfochytrium polystomum]|nr:hypothetical protein DFJ73DRAFT_827821 [Zopfochytrium polystomum]
MLHEKSPTLPLASPRSQGQNPFLSSRLFSPFLSSSPASAALSASSYLSSPSPPSPPPPPPPSQQQLQQQSVTGASSRGGHHQHARLSGSPTRASEPPSPQSAGPGLRSDPLVAQPADPGGAPPPAPPTSRPPSAGGHSPRPADIVLFVVHGIGNQVDSVGMLGRYAVSIANLKNGVKEVVTEEFAPENAPKVDVVPIEWHSVLHSMESTAKRMSLISLPTTPLFRHLTNDILADILFFFSCFHAAHVLAIVADLLNAAHAKYMKENPGFHGNVVLLGHSLGGIICYDILANQHENPVFKDAESGGGATSPFNSSAVEVDPFPNHTRIKSLREIPQSQTHFEIVYPTLNFRPDYLFSMGSPLGGVFVFRGQTPDSYKLPQGVKYFNIFHFFDPLGYRMEPFYDPAFADIPPVLLQRPSKTTARMRKRVQRAFDTTWKDSRTYFSRITIRPRLSIYNFATSTGGSVNQQNGSGGGFVIPGFSRQSTAPSSLGSTPATLFTPTSEDGVTASRSVENEAPAVAAATLSQPTSPVSAPTTSPSAPASSTLFKAVSAFKGFKSLNHWVAKIISSGNNILARPSSSVLGRSSPVPAPSSVGTPASPFAPSLSADFVPSDKEVERTGLSPAPSKGSDPKSRRDVSPAARLVYKALDERDRVNADHVKLAGTASVKGGESDASSTVYNADCVGAKQGASVEDAVLDTEEGQALGVRSPLNEGLSPLSGSDESVAASGGPVFDEEEEEEAEADDEDDDEEEEVEREGEAEGQDIRGGASGSSAGSEQIIVHGEEVGAAGRLLGTTPPDADEDGRDIFFRPTTLSERVAREAEEERRGGPPVGRTSGSRGEGLGGSNGELAMPPRLSDQERDQAEADVERLAKALPHGRMDHFFTESIMDNMINQYLIGMKAHFTYWTNKDMIYFIVKTSLGGSDK